MQCCKLGVQLHPVSPKLTLIPAAAAAAAAANSCLCKSVCLLQMCRADVSTYCFGLAASMGAFLLTAGTKGKRFSMPNARIMIHQPLGGASGQAVDIEIQAKEIMFHKANLNGIMAECTGQPIDRVSYLHSHPRSLAYLGGLSTSWKNVMTATVRWHFKL